MHLFGSKSIWTNEFSRQNQLKKPTSLTLELNNWFFWCYCTWIGFQTLLLQYLIYLDVQSSAVSTPKSSPIMYIMKKTPAKPMKPVPSKSYPSHFRFWLQQKCFEIVSKHGRNSTCILDCWFLARKFKYLLMREKGWNNIHWDFIDCIIKVAFEMKKLSVM